MIPNLDLKRMIEMTNDQNKTVAAKVELTEEQLRTVSGGDKATSQAPPKHEYLVYRMTEVFISSVQH
jgi:hypothetical protein